MYTYVLWMMLCADACQTERMAPALDKEQCVELAGVYVKRPNEWAPLGVEVTHGEMICLPFGQEPDNKPSTEDTEGTPT